MTFPFHPPAKHASGQGIRSTRRGYAGPEESVRYERIPLGNATQEVFFTEQQREDQDFRIVKELGSACRCGMPGFWH